MKKFAKMLIYSIATMMLLWVSISYIDIIADNLDPNPTHYNWNLFLLFSEAHEEVE